MCSKRVSGGLGSRAGEEKGGMEESSLVHYPGNFFLPKPSLQSARSQMPSLSPSFSGCCVPPGMACSWTILNRSIRRKPRRQVRLGARSELFSDFHSLLIFALVFLPVLAHLAIQTLVIHFVAQYQTHEDLTMDETGVSCPPKLFLIQRVGQGNQVLTTHALQQMVLNRQSVVSTMRQSHTHIAILYLSLLSTDYMR